MGREKGGVARTEYFEAITRATDDLMEWSSNVESSELLLAAGLAYVLVGLSDVEIGLLCNCRVQIISMNNSSTICMHD